MEWKILPNLSFSPNQHLKDNDVWYGARNQTYVNQKVYYDYECPCPEYKMFEYFLCVFSTFGSLVVVLGVHPVSSVLVQVIALLFKSIFHACIRFFQESCAIYCAWLALKSALEIQFSDCTGRQQSCITQTVRIFLARISHSPGGEINCIPVSLEKMRNRRFFRRIQVELLFLSKGEKGSLQNTSPFSRIFFGTF